MIHLQLGFLQIRNIVENTVKQRMSLVLAKGADLDAHPDQMPVAVHLAEFQSRRSAGEMCIRDSCGYARFKTA